MPWEMAVLSVAYSIARRTFKSPVIGPAVLMFRLETLVEGAISVLKPAADISWYRSAVICVESTITSISPAFRALAAVFTSGITTALRYWKLGFSPQYASLRSKSAYWSATYSLSTHMPVPMGAVTPLS